MTVPAYRPLNADRFGAQGSSALETMVTANPTTGGSLLALILNTAAASKTLDIDYVEYSSKIQYPSYR
jgi:hypothetical protein